MYFFLNDANVENCGASKDFGFIYIFVFFLNDVAMKNCGASRGFGFLSLYKRSVVWSLSTKKYQLVFWFDNKEQ